MITTTKSPIEYNPDYDHLKFNDDEVIRKILQYEIIYFSDRIEKINKYGIKQERNLIITNKAIYNLEKKNLKRRIDIKIVKGVTTSSENDEFVIHCIEMDHDYHYVSFKKRKIIQFINDLYFLHFNNFLPFCQINDSSLKLIVTKKDEKKKDITFSKMPITNRMHIEQFLYGTIKSDLMNKDLKQAVLIDFKVINLIGKGNYAKILLVEHISTSTLYVLKVHRKDIAIDNCIIDNIETEFKLLTNLQSNFIINLLSHFQTKERLYFVLPFVKGGDMYQHLKENKFLDEEK